MQGGATILRMGYKTMLQAEPADFFLFLPFTCDILGYVSRKWCKNNTFYLLYIFREHCRGHDVFLGLGGMGPGVTLRNAPVPSGAERVRKLDERDRAGAGCEKIRWSGSGKVAERWAGVTEWAVSGNFDRTRSAHMLWSRLGERVFSICRATYQLTFRTYLTLQLSRNV